MDREAARRLGDTLRNRRTETGLTQQQLADRAGIDWKYYQALENAKGNSAKDSVANPSLQVLRRLADAYDTTVPDLMWDVFGQREHESG